MKDIPKAYEPKEVEDKWYSSWLTAGCFDSNPDSKAESYCIMIPPPNVTGVLTMGHVLNNTIQDILVRRAHGQGRAVLWQPGTDHAGIATQARVEREIRKEGKTRHDLGRVEFVERAKKWRDEHGSIILQQLKRLGAACDWKHTVHTLDPDYSQAVLTAFVKLFERGYIYRGKRMVNWCPGSLTALSDEEVIMKPQKGKLYKVKYELVDLPGEFLEVSTTRPETIMGDTAVAVNPNDERYKSLVGKKVWRPLLREPIPIISDSAVEQEFGTGVLKVTPAHDLIDFQIGTRHNLPIREIMNPDGTLNELAGPEFNGMERFKARKHSADLLAQEGLLLSEEPYEHNVGFSERTDVPVEPRLSEQWFLKYPKIEEAKKIVQEGIVKFWPQRWEKTYLHWLENIQDWCISRQLWWGHRIPVWYKKGKDKKDPANWHISVNGPSDPQNWDQEEDVLDTWASAWLWPFATLGWPIEKRMQERGLNKFYPSTDLVTGPDIIFFWVARMIMAGLEFMGPEKKSLDNNDLEKRKPFSNVYFTGIVRDLHGRKMSKSLGNSPDPLDLIDRFGADGLRFGIMSIAAQGQDLHFSEDRVEQGRHFCNKLWNACRFRQISGESGDNSSIIAIIKRMHFDMFDSDDHAILGKLLHTIDAVNKSLDGYEFSVACQQIYNFFWLDFCDWYVEVAKSKLQNPKLKTNCLAIQDLVIRQILLLLHPYTPFITEELWHLLAYGKENEFILNVNLNSSLTLLLELKHAGIEIFEDAVVEIDNLRQFVSAARSLKAEFKLASKRDLSFFYVSDDQADVLLKNNLSKLLTLMGAKSLVRKTSVTDSPAVLTSFGTLYLSLEGAIDIKSEHIRLSKEKERLEKLINSNQFKLKDEKFITKAPTYVIEGAKKNLDEAKSNYEEVLRLLKTLEKS